MAFYEAANAAKFAAASAAAVKKRKTTVAGLASDPGFDLAVLPSFSVDSDTAFGVPSIAAGAGFSELDKTRAALVKLIPDALGDFALKMLLAEFAKIPKLWQKWQKKKSALESLLDMQAKGTFPKSLPKLAPLSLPSASLSGDIKAAAEAQQAAIAKSAQEAQLALLVKTRQAELASIDSEERLLKTRVFGDLHAVLVEASRVKATPRPRASAAAAAQALLGDGKEAKDAKMDQAPDFAYDNLASFAPNIDKAIELLRIQWDKSASEAMYVVAARIKAQAQNEAQRKAKAEEKRQTEAKFQADAALAAANFPSASQATPGRGVPSAGPMSSQAASSSRKGSRAAQSGSQAPERKGGPQSGSSSKGNSKSSQKSRASSRKSRDQRRGRGRGRGRGSGRGGSRKSRGRGRGRGRGSSRGRGRGRGSRKF